MPTQRSLFSRTMISLPLPAAILAVGSIGMAWASSSSPESDPARTDTPSSTSQTNDGGTYEVSTVRSGRKAAEYWTPERMRDAKPARMPVRMQVRGAP